MTTPQFVLSADGLIASQNTPENQEVARRVIACVEACEGISTEELESGIIRDMRQILNQVIPLLEERNELISSQNHESSPQ
ncbi:MAG: hypothetical protein O2955_05375 [Planctomycetota bacterium]|nr:hypothetical protein [Planctomycetota bacterium]MDA1211923.1 hypothetical protein [Planctomycetota bacterium]